MGKGFKKDVGAVVRKSGVSFRVWAPFAQQVGLTGSFNNWSELPMDSENDGYWYTLVKGAEPGQEYKFVIRNGDKTLVKNDPRALQVTTSAGNSVIVDPEFDWGGVVQPSLPFNQLVLYEMHAGTFNRPDPAAPGTFETAMQKLDYLADLGVNMIELMPIASMSTEREWWGYTPDYIYAVEALYGGRHQFLEFIKSAHQRGIAVILDVVYNHLGPDKSLDLWQFDGWSENGKGGVYFYNDWRCKTPWADTRPDYGRQEVQQYILDNVRLWLHDYRLDGLRVDSTIYIRNANGYNDSPGDDIPEGWNLLQNINRLAKKIKPDSLVVAEDVGANDYITKSAGEGGADFSAQWAVTLPHALRSVLDAVDDNERDLEGLCLELSRYFNGDAFRRVVYSDSHDSAANGGARLSEEITPGNASSAIARKRSLLASAIVLSAPGIPMLFQGQEFMQGGSFNDWQALEWDKAGQFPGIVEAHKHLIALRKNLHGVSAGLMGQSFKLIHRDNDNKVIAYHRWQNGGSGDDVVVIVNFGNRLHQTYNLNFPRPGTWKVRFNSAWKGYSPDFKNVQVPDVNVNEAGGGSVVLPPSSAIILSQDQG